MAFIWPLYEFMRTHLYYTQCGSLRHRTSTKRCRWIGAYQNIPFTMKRAREYATKWSDHCTLYFPVSAALLLVLYDTSYGHISVLRNATVTSLGMLVVLHVLCMLTCPWPDPRSRSSRQSKHTLFSHLA